MRNLVMFLILGFAGWWGYTNWWVPADGATEAGNGSEGAAPEAGGDAGIENEYLPNAATGGHELVNHGAGAEAAAEARRLIQALRAQDYSQVQVDAGLQSSLLGNAAALYSLEVGLALGRPDGPSADLAGSADALMKLATQDTLSASAELLCSGLQTLVKQKLPEAALEALGTTNGFMMGKTSRSSDKAVAAYLAAMRNQDVEDAALLLSSLVTRMTRGGDVWNGSRYKALRLAVESLYGALDEVLLTPEGVWRSSYVKVGSGGNLSGIANRFERKTGIPVAPGLIQMVNGIRNVDNIRAGQRLRIPTERMEIVVSRKSYTMRIYLGDLLLRLYQVGIGKKGHATPLGEYHVIEKQIDPPWYHPDGGVIPPKDPRNLLGRYFLKLKHKHRKGFGIHGTKDQATVGRRASLGCMRVRKDDMPQLFSIIPRKTVIRVED